MGVTLNKKKSTGDWYVWINHGGKRISKKIGANYQTAVAVAAEFRKKLALDEVEFSTKNEVAVATLTFGEFFRDFMENVAKLRLKYNSWMSYQKLADLYLLPSWKDRKLDSLTRQDVKTLLLQKQAEGLVINNIKVCISAILAEAVEREILTINPAHNLGRFFRRGLRKTQTHFLTREQTATLLSAAKQIRPEYYDLLLTAFRTGMRLGELLALAWDSVNFDTKKITVQRSFSHDHWDIPKSNKIRYIDMSNGLYNELLERFKKRDANLACNSYKNKKISLVFPDNLGEPICDDFLRRTVFYSLLKKAKLPKIRVHDIRHTYASLLLQAGAPIHYVKEQMGHSSITTTVDLYGHCQPNVNRDAVNRLD